jgi:wyosine [tRNA(Phe)-imidazoG37] synthetase (radical SAM superfamily)
MTLENQATATIIFGPVPSRRLGRSLGINNIPPKNCSYSCVYCQVGRTMVKQITAQTFYRPEEIENAVTAKVKAALAADEKIDYLTFVPDGEPTLDIHLGEVIDRLRPLGIKIAVISNASLIWREEVQHILNKADWVSLKIDSVDEATWKQINRPHESLKLPIILRGIESFAQQYQGELATETMLIEGVNDNRESIESIAEFLFQLEPHKAYLAIPTRPPAETNIRAPDEKVITRAYQLMKKKCIDVEYLIDYEGDAFALTSGAEQDLLAITAVHPMREQAVQKLLSKTSEDWDLIQRLLAENKIKRVEYDGQYFYVRCLHH